MEQYKSWQEWVEANNEQGDGEVMDDGGSWWRGWDICVSLTWDGVLVAMALTDSHQKRAILVLRGQKQGFRFPTIDVAIIPPERREKKQRFDKTIDWWVHALTSWTEAYKGTAEHFNVREAKTVLASSPCVSVESCNKVSATVGIADVITGYIIR